MAEYTERGLAKNLETLERIATALEELVKAVREPHYDTNDGAIRVSVTK